MFLKHILIQLLSNSQHLCSCPFLTKSTPNCFQNPPPSVPSFKSLAPNDWQNISPFQAACVLISPLLPLHLQAHKHTCTHTITHSHARQAHTWRGSILLPPPACFACPSPYLNPIHSSSYTFQPHNIYLLCLYCPDRIRCHLLTVCVTCANYVFPAECVETMLVTFGSSPI